MSDPQGPPPEDAQGSGDQEPRIYPPPGTSGQPPSGTGAPGWGTPPGPGQAPPPQDPYAHLRRDHPRATAALVLGIVGLVLCSVAAPFAWVIGRNAVREIDQSQGILTGRGQAQAGAILGIIGTVLLVIGLLALLLFLVLGLAFSTNVSTG